MTVKHHSLLIDCIHHVVLPVVVVGIATGTFYALAAGASVPVWLPALCSAWIIVGCAVRRASKNAKWEGLEQFVATTLLWPWKMNGLHERKVIEFHKNQHVGVLFVFALASVTFIAQAPGVKDLPIEIQRLSTFIQVLAFGQMVVWAVSAFARQSAILSICTRFLVRVWVLFMALALIGYQAHHVQAALHWSTNNSAVLLLSLTAVVFMQIVVRSKHPEAIEGAMALSPKIISTHGNFQPPTLRDHRSICVHESGHVMMFSLLDAVPSDLQVHALSSNDQPHLGSTSSFEWPHRLKSKALSEWRMLTLLAGQSAELAQLHDACFGSAADYNQWQEEAMSYLENGFGGMYFHTPKNDQEMSVNVQTIACLHAKHVELLERFFKLNMETLKDLSECLALKNHLVRDDLLPFLTRVTAVPGMPRPKMSTTKDS